MSRFSRFLDPSHAAGQCYEEEDGELIGNTAEVSLLDRQRGGLDWRMSGRVE